jgi:hypothetical protein
MTDEEKKKFLNDKRDKNFAEMKKVVDSGDVDMMARKAMDFFGIPEEKRALVDGVIKKWTDSRSKAEDGIRGQMDRILEEKAGDF